MSFRSTCCVGVVAAMLVIIACADFKRGEVWVEDTSLGDTGTSSGGLGYASDIHSLLRTDCAGCHASGGSAGNTSFVLTTDAATDYPNTLDAVDLDRPELSPLLSKATGAGHVGGEVWIESSAAYQLTQTWIEQGANP